MTFSWRRRMGLRGCARKNDASKGSNLLDLEFTIPSHFRCPISLDLMKDPVTLSTGITYDRDSIEKWLEMGHVTCPVTNRVLRNFDQIPNHSIRKMIQDWCVENRSSGVERIPTPRIPIHPLEVSEICTRIQSATSQHVDSRKCFELLAKIKNLSKESERNKRRLVQNGIGVALASSFESLSCLSIDKHLDLLKEILSILTWTFPLAQEGVSKLRTSISLRCMAWFLKNEDDLSSRQNTIFVLKQLISQDQECVNGLMEIKGIEETLFGIVKVPICPKATKATLMIIHHMMTSLNEKISGLVTVKFVEMGLVHLILGVIVDGDKSVCAKALSVLDSICDCKEGRESAYENAITIPLLVKKILRVSDAATELAISSLWKLISMGESENVPVEAVQFGAFQKLLVVLQIGSGERTKEKVTELLKLMNLYRDKLDCFDSSMGFKYVNIRRN